MDWFVRISQICLPQTDVMVDGRDLEIGMAQGLALGNIHPETMLPIEDLWPDFKPVARKAAKARDSEKVANHIIIGLGFG